MHPSVRGCRFVLVLGAALAIGADWPQFRGPDGSGVSSAKSAPTTWGPDKNLAWKVKLPGAGGSAPVVFGKKIFVACYSGYNVPGERGDMDQLKRHLVCLDRATGEHVWTTDLPVKLPEQDRIRDDHGYSSNTPVVDAERVYVFCGKSGVFALDHDGKQLWQADVGSKLNGWGSAASPLLAGDLLIVNASVESGSLVALNKKTGEEVWRAGEINESWNTPLLVTPPEGKPEVVVAVFGKVLGFDPATGEQKWSCKTDIGWYMVPSVVAHEGIVYCIGGRGTGGSLAVRVGGAGEVTETHRLWKARAGANVPSPIYHDGYLYWAHDSSGSAYCADAKTGKVVYQQRLGRAAEIYASPVLAGGQLYYTDRAGKTFVVAAKPEYEQLAVNDLRDGSLFHGAPAVADGRLLIRSNKYLYCIGAPE